MPKTRGSRPRRPRKRVRRAFRHRATAFSASRPSSTTSASARPASRAATSAGSPRRCSTRSSAARPPRGSSRRSARSAGWRTRSTASPRSTPTPARSASTSARARRTSSSAWRSSRASSRDVADGNVSDGELDRAKENLEGTDAALDGVDLEPDEPARQVADHRLELLSLEELVDRVDAVTGDEVAPRSPATCSALDRLSAAGIGPERGTVPALRCSASTRRSSGASAHEGLSCWAGTAKVGSVLAPALEEAVTSWSTRLTTPSALLSTSPP